jgi:hypothetical protein
MAIDPRSLSQHAYRELVKLKSKLDEDDCKKASGVIQGLPSYIATWGLYRLSGDAGKFANERAEKTTYKSQVYYHFLKSLSDESISGIKLKPENVRSLLDMELRDYTALNRFAMQLAKEWSFWTASVLGEAEVE